VYCGLLSPLILIFIILSLGSHRKLRQLIIPLPVSLTERHGKIYEAALRSKVLSKEFLQFCPMFAEAYNSKAIALSYKKDYDNAIKNVKKSLEIKPNLSAAHENLAKLVLSAGKSTESFWAFWTASWSKRVIAIIIGIFALGITIYYPLYFGSETVQNTEQIGNQTKITTTSIKPAKIPEYYFIVVGLAILLLLVPELRKAKVGPLELDLAEDSRCPQVLG
jgi:tetratricopeptide (TPR) repeat protein